MAGIIGGDLRTSDLSDAAVGRARFAPSRGIATKTGTVVEEQVTIDNIRGVAPECKIVSMKILGDDGKGAVSNAIAALEEINRINGYGKELRIHGVNMSVGYDVRSRVVRVRAESTVQRGRSVGRAPAWSSSSLPATPATATSIQTMHGAVAAGLALTINDPGNADSAITVGSTHREMPHVYGVSYFSSKGPTGDGRLKPDLVAPGEKILSCGAASR